jgi:hypothetical protein
MIHSDHNVRVNVTLDGDPMSTVTNTHAAGTAMKTYNVSLYDVQELPFGYHQVNILLLDWTPGCKSALLFDYAAVNDTRASPSLFPSARPPVVGSPRAR